MRKSLLAVAMVGVVGGLGATAQATNPFQPGDLVIYRVGDGANALVSSGSPVTLDEYTPSGTLVQSVPLPTSASGANAALFASGTATSEGLLTLSADGRYLLLTGYSSTSASGSLASTTAALIPRVVGRVDLAGNIDTSTRLTNFADVNNPRSAASTDGTNIWVGGASGGIGFITLGGSTVSTVSITPNDNFRQLTIINGQLLASYTASTGPTGSKVANGHLVTIGTGTPTASGQTQTDLPGFPTLSTAGKTNNGSPYSFVMATLDPNDTSPDTLYVADDNANAIEKFSLVGGSWVSNGNIKAANVRGLTAFVTGTSIDLFGSTGGGAAAGGGSLYSFVDTTGYNGTLVGATANTIASAPADEAFRGVVIIPSPEPGSIALLVAGGGLLALRRRRAIH